MKINTLGLFCIFLLNSMALQAMFVKKGTGFAPWTHYSHALPKSSMPFLRNAPKASVVFLGKGREYTNSHKSECSLWQRYIPAGLAGIIAVGIVKSLQNEKKEPEAFKSAKKYETIAFQDIQASPEHADLIKKLKVLAPEDPRQNFEEILEELNARNITLCELMQKICEDKRNRALLVSIQDGNFDPKTIIMTESINHDEFIPLTIIMSSSQLLTQKVQDTIEKIFPKNKYIIRYQFVNEKDLESRIDAQGKAQFTYNNEQPTIVTNIIDNVMTLADRDLNGEQGSLLGTLRHERQHLFALDHVHKSIIPYLIGEVSRINKMEMRNIDRNFHQLSRAQEAAADRIPAACQCLQASDNICSMVNSFPQWSSNMPKSTHPTNQSRFEWAEKIRRLRHINQENLIKDELYGLV